MAYSEEGCAIKYKDGDLVGFLHVSEGGAWIFDIPGQAEYQAAELIGGDMEWEIVRVRVEEIDDGV